ncbi:MAG: hypothetical protein QGF59_16305, partial [Pirellulaceae bacterium]|nr:hypothetical protein [Pirellulaceae bacterium]
MARLRYSCEQQQPQKLEATAELSSERGNAHASKRPSSMSVVNPPQMNVVVEHSAGRNARKCWFLRDEFTEMEFGTQTNSGLFFHGTAEKEHCQAETLLGAEEEMTNRDIAN